jgi:hypothetical protein
MKLPLQPSSLKRLPLLRSRQAGLRIRSSSCPPSHVRFTTTSYYDDSKNLDILMVGIGAAGLTAAIRAKHHGLAPTNVAPNDTGDALTLTLKHNLATTLLEDSWWEPTIRDPSTGQTYWCQFERTLPHSIIVDSSGGRRTGMWDASKERHSMP